MRVAAFEAHNAQRRQIALTRTEKRCHTCERMLPVGEFYRNRSRCDGLADICRGCQVARNAVDARARRARRLPLEPLVAQVALRGGAFAVWGRSSWQARAFERSVADGCVKPRVADALACDLGLHPALLWPSWFPVAP